MSTEALRATTVLAVVRDVKIALASNEDLSRYIF
jgi:hypothetical protein